jgi:hypothetical protein
METTYTHYDFANGSTVGVVAGPFAPGQSVTPGQTETVATAGFPDLADVRNLEKVLGSAFAEFEVSVEDDEEGTVFVRLVGAMISQQPDGADRIVPAVKLWDCSGTVTVEVTLSGQVEAATEEEAQELFEDALRSASIDAHVSSNWSDTRLEVDDVNEIDSDVLDISEADTY